MDQYSWKQYRRSIVAMISRTKAPNPCPFILFLESYCHWPDVTIVVAPGPVFPCSICLSQTALSGIYAATPKAIRLLPVQSSLLSLIDLVLFPPIPRSPLYVALDICMIVILSSAIHIQPLIGICRIREMNPAFSFKPFFRSNYGRIQ